MFSNRIQDGYQWLAENFAEGDQIYLVGFRAGAPTARSLVGMIRPQRRATAAR
ncbi:MAG: DUF2235 domain-containing protein [Micropruina glycogenica]